VSRKLTLGDIADLRAYERERGEFRERVIALKKRRRVPVGPLVTLTFENRDTMRFQVQEMARAEKIISDDAIQHELDTYNALIPEPGTLSATLFVELTSKEQLQEWLPKLVGIERCVELIIGSGGRRATSGRDGSGPATPGREGHVPGSLVVKAVPEESHDEQLTRPDVTASVHYVRFELSAEQIERFAAEPVVLAVNHRHYAEGVTLGDETKAELLADLRDG
jgi:hypothetical protein